MSAREVGVTPVAVSVTVRMAVRTPGADGVNVTVTKQAPGAPNVPHPAVGVTTEKSEALVRVTAGGPKVVGASVVNVTAWGVLVTPTVWVEKVAVTGVGVTAAGTINLGAVVANVLGVARNIRPELNRASARMRATNPVI